MFTRRTLPVALLASILLLVAGLYLARPTHAVPPADSAPAPAKLPRALRLTIVPVSPADSDDNAFHLDLVLHNASSKDLNLYLGYAAGNNSALYPLAFTLTAVDKAGKPHIVPVGPDLMEIGGRLDPFIVSLPAGGSYSLRTSSALGGPKPAEPGRSYLAPGAYSFTATFTGTPLHEKPRPADLYTHDLTSDLLGYALMPFWTGTLTSPAVTLTVPAGHP